MTSVDAESTNNAEYELGGDNWILDHPKRLEQGIYSFPCEKMDGTKFDTIKDLVGDAKAILVVNVASV